MTDAMDQQFLADIMEHPADDGLRLIYADWLSDQAYEPGNERTQAITEAKSEFICAQVALAAGEEHGMPISDERRSVLEAREKKMLEQHQTTWGEPLRALGAKEVTFRRGLPDGVAISAAALLSNAEELFALAPIQAVALLDATPEQVESLAKSPHLKNLTHLDLRSLAIGNEGARALAQSPHLTNLTSLYLGKNVIDTEGARALAESPHLTNLTHLDLGYNNIDTEGARALAESPNLTSLTHLNLWNNYEIGTAFVREIERSMARRRQVDGQER